MLMGRPTGSEDPAGLSTIKSWASKFAGTISTLTRYAPLVSDLPMPREYAQHGAHPDIEDRIDCFPHRSTVKKRECAQDEEADHEGDEQGSAAASCATGEGGARAFVERPEAERVVGCGVAQVFAWD